MGDASSLFEPVIKTQPRNQASITSGDLRGILDAVAEMERRIKEMEPEQKEIGYFDSIFMGFSTQRSLAVLKSGNLLVHHDDQSNGKQVFRTASSARNSGYG